MVDLASQFVILDRAFLSGIIVAPPDPLNDEERALIRGYLVLSHAILEERLEDAITEYFDKLTGVFHDPIVPRDGLAVAFAISQLSGELKNTQASKHDVPTMLKQLGRSALQTQIRLNNGIKEENLKQLTRLVGLNWSETEAAMSEVLPDLNTLGAKRGEAGHLSPFSAAATAITDDVGPDEVREWVTNGRLAVERFVGYLETRLAQQIGQLPALVVEP